MKAVVRSGVVAACAVLATMCLLGLILGRALNMEPITILRKMSADAELYIFPIVILCEFYFFINDILFHLSRKYQLHLGIDFPEIRFRYDLNSNAIIPLRAKLWGLYPSTIALTLLGFVLLLLNRS
ncbi:MAG: hypothetical protein ACREEK_07340 [Bradyrhizobium sp.]